LPSGADKSIEWYPGRLAALMKEKKKGTGLPSIL